MGLSRDERTTRKNLKTQQVNQFSAEPIGCCACATERITPRDESFFPSHIKDSFKNDSSLLITPKPSVADSSVLCRWNQIRSWAWGNFGVFRIFCKTNFCELVLGFSLNLGKNIAVQFSGLSRSIIIKNMVKFILWEAITGSFRKGACPNIPKSLNENSKLHETRWAHATGDSKQACKVSGRSDHSWRYNRKHKRLKTYFYGKSPGFAKVLF